MKYLSYLNLLIGYLIALSNICLRVYVKEYLQGAGDLLTACDIISSIPWTIKFLYGVPSDFFYPKKKQKIKILTVLALLGILFNVLPLVLGFNATSFKVLTFFISLPIASFQCILNAYITLIRKEAPENEEIIEKSISNNWLGRLASFIVLICFDNIIKEGKRKSAFLFLSAFLTSIFLFILCILEYISVKKITQTNSDSSYTSLDSSDEPGPTQTSKLNLSKPEDINLADTFIPPTDPTENNNHLLEQEELYLNKQTTNSEILEDSYFIETPSNFRQMLNSFLSKVLATLCIPGIFQLFIFLSVLSLVPYFSGYIYNWMVSPRSKQGLGIGYSFWSILQIISYSAGVLGNKLYKKYKEFRDNRRKAYLAWVEANSNAATAEEKANHLLKEKKSLHIKEIRTEYGAVLVFSVFGSILTYVIYLCRNTSESVVKTVLVMTNVFGSLADAPSTVIGLQIVSDLCKPGTEGTFFALYTSILNLQGLISERLSIFVVGIVASRMGMNSDESNAFVERLLQITIAAGAMVLPSVLILRG